MFDSATMPLEMKCISGENEKSRPVLPFPGLFHNTLHAAVRGVAHGYQPPEPFPRDISSTFGLGGLDPAGDFWARREKCPDAPPPAFERSPAQRQRVAGTAE